MPKIVDGIDMEKVDGGKLKEVIAALNDTGLCQPVKDGVNPLGSAKAFVKAVEALDEDKQGQLPAVVQDYYNLIVVSDEELAEIQTDTGKTVTTAEKQEAKKKPAAQKVSQSVKKAEPKLTPAKKAEAKAPAPKKSGEGMVTLEDSMTIVVVEGKEPKNKESKAYQLVQLYKKFKTVGAFLKKSGWPRARAALNFDRYHGRIILK